MIKGMANPKHTVKSTLALRGKGSGVLQKKMADLFGIGYPTHFTGMEVRGNRITLLSASGFMVNDVVEMLINRQSSVSVIHTYYDDTDTGHSGTKEFTSDCDEPLDDCPDTIGQLSLFDWLRKAVTG